MWTRPAHWLPALVGALGYGWWATGVRTFTTGAYVAVGAPVLLALAVTIAQRRRSRGRPLSEAADWPGRTAGPWVAILLASVVLEVIGLALGGRSHLVPTLSDVADRGLKWHATRALAFALWLALGASIAIGRGRTRPEAAG